MSETKISQMHLLFKEEFQNFPIYFPTAKCKFLDPEVNQEVIDYSLNRHQEVKQEYTVTNIDAECLDLSCRGKMQSVPQEEYEEETRKAADTLVGLKNSKRITQFSEFMNISEPLVEDDNKPSTSAKALANLIKWQNASQLSELTNSPQNANNFVGIEEEYIANVKKAIEKIAEIQDCLSELNSISEEEMTKLTLTILECWRRVNSKTMDKSNINGEEVHRLKLKLNELEKQIEENNIEIEADPINVEAGVQQPAQLKQTPPISKNIGIDDILKKLKPSKDGMIKIGPNGTLIAEESLKAFNWPLSGAALTRKVLVEVFGRNTLRTHTLTGRPSPAFVGCNKPKKSQLDPLKIADITDFIVENTKLTANEVRKAIVTRCADENKTLRAKRKEKEELLNIKFKRRL